MALRARLVPALVAIVVLASSVAFGAPRVVLFEESTNWGCVPCYQAAPYIHQVMQNFGSQVAAVKWHVWWPSSNDPWYLHNAGPVNTRISYYAINAAPDIVVDGQNGPDPFSVASMTQWINNRLAIPAPLSIAATTGTIIGPNCTCSFAINVETPQAGSSFKLFCAVTEEDIPNNNPNGETHNYDVFRQVNASTGETIDLSAAGVQNFTRNLPYYPSYNITGLHMVIWVQNYTTREVLQAAEVPLLAPYHFNYIATGPTTQIGTANEVMTYTSRINNDGANNDVYNVSVTGVPAGWAYSYTTPEGTFSGPSTLPLNTGQLANITLNLDSQGLPGSATTTMTFASQADPVQVLSLAFTKFNSLGVLLVDDDGGEARESVTGPALTAAGMSWGRWDLWNWGALTGQDLLDASRVVVWECGTSSPSFTTADQQAVTAFLAAGGDLFTTGSDIGWSLADPGSPYYSLASKTWYEQTLHATYTQNFSFTITINGVAGDPITDGFSGVVLSSAPYLPGLPDGIQAGPGADFIWTFQGQAHKGGTRYSSGSSQVVYFSFPFENLPQESQRNLVMQRVLEYFGASSGVPGPSEAPAVAHLAQNSPNPFTPATTIAYSLAETGNVKLRIYDLTGRMVRELRNGTEAAARHEVTWDGRDAAGRELPSGVYFYQLNAPGIHETRRMVLAR